MPTSRKTVALCCIVAAYMTMPATAFGAPAHAPRLATIAAPGDEALVRSSSVQVKVRTRGRVDAVNATVDGRKVKLVPRRGGEFSATVRRLARGPHALSVLTRDGGRRDVDVVRFVRGQHARSVISVRLPSVGGGPVRARVSAPRPVERLRARLNGRRIGGRFLSRTGLLRSASLSPSDGLRYGRNVLTVLAVRANGAYDRERHVVRVTRAAPLAAAGSDRLRRRGASVRLDGRASLASRQGQLSYRWRIVARPRGSRARLRGAASARPRLRLDRRGVFRIALRVTDRRRGGRRAGASASSRADVVSLVSQPDVPPIGTPVDTGAVCPDGTPGIELLGACTEPVVQGALQVLVVDRQTLALQSNTAVEPPSFGNLAAALPAPLTPQSLVLVQGTALPLSSSQISGLNTFLGSIGAQPIEPMPPGMAAGTPVTVGAIGVPGSDVGNAWQTTDWTAGEGDGVSGYLTTDAWGNYTYTPGSPQPFNTVVPNQPLGTNVISVGGAQYSATMPAGSVGFQVLALDAHDLGLISNQAVVTNSPSDPFPYNTLQAALQPYVGDSDVIVIFQSMSAVAGAVPQTTPGWDNVAQVIEALGGNRAVFDSQTGGYTLVGGAGVDFPASEASPSLTSTPQRTDPAALSGMLMPGHSGAYQPSAADPYGIANAAGLAELVYQEPTPWPVGDPEQGTPGELAAGAYIASNYDSDFQTLADLRTAYWFLPQAEFGECDNQAGPPNVSPPSQFNNFSQQDFDNVLAELQKEFDWVSCVRNVFGVTGGTTSDLQTPFLDETSQTYADLQILAGNVVKAVAPPQQQASASGLDEILSDIFDIAWALTPLLPSAYEDPASIATGVLNGGLGLIADTTNEPDGSSEVQTIESAAPNLGLEAVQTLQDTAQQLPKIGQILVSDYGKLAVAGPGAGNTWWDSDVSSNVLDFVEGGMLGWAYSNMLPVAYQGYLLQPGVGGEDGSNEALSTAQVYKCWTQGNFGNSSYEPFKSLPSTGSGELAVISADGGPQGYIGTIWALGTKINRFKDNTTSKVVSVPTQDLTDPLFQPYVPDTATTNGGGVGLYKPWFFADNFTRQSLTCGVQQNPPQLGPLEPPGSPTP
jgi:hypothetical protein